MSGTSGRGFYELEIYKRYEEISDVLWKVVFDWNYEIRSLIGHQLLRAIDSVGANIAESVGRGHLKESLKFLFYSRGSLTEAQHWVRRAARQNLIGVDVLNKLRDTFLILGKQLNAFINAQAPEHATQNIVSEEPAPYGEFAF